VFQSVQYHDVDPTSRPTPKDRLLEALVTHVGERGLADASMRQLAAAIGTSHRMLAYHFGSRRDLLLAISRAVERQQRAAFNALLADPAACPTEIMWSMYRRLVDPALRSQERLFFELYAVALRDGSASDGFLPEVVEAWIPPLSELFRRVGFDERQAAAEARLALAVARGLLLDLLAAEDRPAVDAAMRRFVSRYEPPAG